MIDDKFFSSSTLIDIGKSPFKGAYLIIRNFVPGCDKSSFYDKKTTQKVTLMIILAMQIRLSSVNLNETSIFLRLLRFENILTKKSICCISHSMKTIVRIGNKFELIIVAMV